MASLPEERPQITLRQASGWFVHIRTCQLAAMADHKIEVSVLWIASDSVNVYIYMGL
jgi:hypothetical protein